jgi:hypothetical protein
VGNLLSNFVEYPGYYVGNNNMYMVLDKTLEWCSAECRNNATCRHLEYRSSLEQCSGSSSEISIILSTHPSLLISSSAMDLYVKTCA